jgi:DNA-binding SARP family transcriptional activator
VLEFGILGPLLVRGDDGEVAVTGARRRALLVRLLTSANQTISAERLAEDLWEGSPPSGAASTLQSHVSFLRRTLGADRIRHRDGGYVLDLHSGSLDTHLFEADLNEGKKALAAGDAEAAVGKLQRALAHWRGPALADVATAEWATPEVTRLEELRLSSLEAWHEALLALGRHHDVIASAEALVAQQPLRERFWAQLMLSLYRSGRQAEALRAFQRLRTKLREELGIEPSSELVALDESILLHRSDLDWRPSTERWPASGTGRPSGTVTLLFTDIEGSTRLWDQHREAMAEALRRHDQVVRECIESSEGYVFKTVGDAFCAVFGSAAQAVVAATAVQRTVGTESWPKALELRVRVALHTGICEERDGDYFGPPLNRIARLMDIAHGGQTVVSRATAELIQDALPSGISLLDLGEHHLKDLGRPERVFQLEIEGIGTKLAARGSDRPSTDLTAAGSSLSMPLPSRLVSGIHIPFVGRETELELLRNTWKHAQQGARRILLIGGEPGIGKTALARALAQTVIDEEAIALYGRCDEDLGIPYQPWAEAIGHLIRHGPQTVFDNHVPARMAELARLVPELVERTGIALSGAVADESERYLLFGAVVDLLTRSTQQAPTLLVLDDLHWADRPTVQLLRHVISADAERLLIVATYRDSELGVDHPLAEALAGLHREAGVDRVGLKGLNDLELIALLEAIAGHELPNEGVFLRDALLDDTGGNPFFVVEILRHLAETGALSQSENGRWTATTDLSISSLPVSVREVIGHRVAGLGKSATQWLTMAAVIGRDFDIDLLSAVVQVDSDDLMAVLEDAVAAAILVEGSEPGEFSFAHALFEHSLYRDLSSLRRARAHRAVAEAIEDACGDDDPGARVSELAYHWGRATQPQELDKTIVYARMAGDRALRQLAPDEAVRWYSQALQLLERQGSNDDSLRVSLMVRLGDARRQAGDPSHREVLLDAARRADGIGDYDSLVAAALANNRGFHSSTGSGDSERVEILRLALERLGQTDSAERARLLAILSVETLHFLQFDERLDLAREAVECARRVGNELTLADVLVRSHEAISMPETLALRSAWAEEAAQLVPAESHYLRWLIHGVRAIVAFESADLPRLQESMAVFDAEASAIGQPVCRWVNTIYKSWFHVLTGDLLEAEVLANSGLSLGTEFGQPDAWLLYGAQLIDIRYSQGRLGELLPVLEQLVSDYPGEPTVFRALQCLSASESGDLEATRALLDRDLASDFEIYKGATWLTGQVGWAIAAARVGHLEAARLLYDRLTPWESQIPTISITAAIGCVANVLGSLADTLHDFSAAERWFRRAIEIDQSMFSPFHTACTKVAWARMLTQRNERHDVQLAVRLLSDAKALSRDRSFVGIDRDVRAIEELLRKQLLGR